MLCIFNRCQRCTFFCLIWRTSLSFKCILISLGFSDVYLSFNLRSQKMPENLSVVHADQLLKGFLFSSFSPTEPCFLIWSVASKLHFLSAVEWKDLTCTSLISQVVDLCSKWFSSLSFLLLTLWVKHSQTDLFKSVSWAQIYANNCRDSWCASPR